MICCFQALFSKMSCRFHPLLTSLSSVSAEDRNYLPNIRDNSSSNNNNTMRSNVVVVDGGGAVEVVVVGIAVGFLLSSACYYELDRRLRC